MALESPSVAIDRLKTLNREAPELDERLHRYINYRLKMRAQKTIDGAESDDIKNSSWRNVLQQPVFLMGCTGVRITYLRTAANWEIQYLTRREKQRYNGLRRSGEKALNGWCVVQARDVQDHHSFGLGNPDDRNVCLCQQTEMPLLRCMSRHLLFARSVISGFLSSFQFQEVFGDCRGIKLIHERVERQITRDASLLHAALLRYRSSQEALQLSLEYLHARLFLEVVPWVGQEGPRSQLNASTGSVFLKTIPQMVLFEPVAKPLTV